MAYDPPTANKLRPNNEVTSFVLEGCCEETSNSTNAEHQLATIQLRDGFQLILFQDVASTTN